ncbi:MAG: OprO/OprP family phosphate-selective porin [Proteobacteria bacterium]|nr:OprO/OprP family phosphate-selective porin [Pseudomonadota bacterium]
MKKMILLILFCAVAVEAKVSFDFGGRMEVDYTFYDDEYTQFISDDYNVRRFRFGLFTKFNDKFSIYLQSDFAKTDKTKKGATQAAWIRYRVNKHNEFYLGKMEMPFSLESVSNSKYNFFMERSIASALTERYGTGFNYIHYGNNWNMRIGLFGDDHYNLGSSSTYGQSATARIGKKFKALKGRIYLGVSAQYREPDETVRVRALPESNTFSRRLLNTGELFFINKINKYGLEALWKNDNWALQAEYIQNIFQRAYGSDLDYRSGYFVINRMFNGKRRFSFKKGEWNSPKVKNWKTWELSARYSFLDLNTQDLNAGYEENISVGVNYYISNKNRIMFNYIQAKATPNSFGIDETLYIYQVRFQYEF